MKTKYNSLIVVIAVAFLITGCSSLYEPRLTVDSVENNTLISGTSDIATTRISKRGSDIVSCNAPPPDTAFSQIDDTSVSISIVSTSSDDGGNEEGTTASELAGRTPGLLYSRELFFRTCELTRDHNLTKEEAIKLFSETRKIVGDGWLIEAKNTKITVGDTVTATSNETDGLSLTGTDKLSETATSSNTDALSETATSSDTDTTSSDTDTTSSDTDTTSDTTSKPE